MFFCNLFSSFFSVCLAEKSTTGITIAFGSVKKGLSSRRLKNSVVKTFIFSFKTCARFILNQKSGFKSSLYNDSIPSTFKIEDLIVNHRKKKLGLKSLSHFPYLTHHGQTNLNKKLFSVKMFL